jgi:L-fucose isomerase
MMLVIRDLMEGNPKLKRRFGEESKGHNALAAGFQGQRQWTDFLPNGDLAEAVLCSSFGPWGIAQPRILATENDSLNAVSMLLGHLITGAASVFADVRTYWSPDAVLKATGERLQGNAAQGIIHLINSGPAALDGTGAQKDETGTPVIKPWWDVTSKDANDCLQSVEWCYGDLGYFRGGGYSTRFATQGGMPVTMVRLNLIKGLGPVMQLAEGWTVSLPAEMHHILDMRTNPSWPTTWFAPRLTGKGAFTDVYSVMANWGANHGAFHYGHIGDHLLTLASLLRIPVSLHNIEPERIFRPSAWSAFGTNDLEGADYRACQAYGPLYRCVRGLTE